MSKTFYKLEALKTVIATKNILCISRTGKEYYKKEDVQREVRSGVLVTVNLNDMIFCTIETAQGVKRSFTGMLRGLDNNTLTVGIVSDSGKIDIQKHSFFAIRRLNVLHHSSVSIWLGSLPVKQRLYKAVGTNKMRGVYLDDKTKPLDVYCVAVNGDHMAHVFEYRHTINKRIAEYRRVGFINAKNSPQKESETVKELNTKALRDPAYIARLQEAEKIRREAQSAFDKHNHDGHIQAYKSHVENSWAAFKARRKAARKAA